LIRAQIRVARLYQHEIPAAVHELAQQAAAMGLVIAGAKSKKRTPGEQLFGDIVRSHHQVKVVGTWLSFSWPKR